MAYTIVTDNINKWLANGERGISSETILGHLIGVQISKYKHAPSDPSDFNRCLKLIEQCPELRPLLKHICDISQEWFIVYSNWDVLEEMMKEARLIWAKGGKATEMFNYMDKIGL